MDHILFETSRLIARRIIPSDVDAMVAVYGDADAMRWVGDGQPLTRALCERWVEVTHNNYATRGYGMTALVDAGTGAVMGFCGIVHPGGQPEAELKYALRRDYWGRGFATEAAAGMLAYASETFGLTRIIATVVPAHTASQRVLLKAGMQPLELRPNDDSTFTQVFVWLRDPGHHTP